MTLKAPKIAATDFTIHDAVTVLLHEMSHAFLIVSCGRSDLGFIAESDRHLKGQARCHATSFQLVIDALQKRLGRTRCCHLRSTMREDMGEVPEASP